MKKILLSIAVITAAICANAQGLWKATGTEASIAASTEITLTGITGLKCMHSDPTGVIGKSDSGSPTTTYNGVSFDNPAIVQGNTNEMYYAFLPAKSGVMDVAIKMGSNKATFVLELKDVTTVEGLANLTTTYSTFGSIPTANWTAPSVYDTYNNSKGTWNGSTPIQNTGANVYLVISIPVTANKTYIVGCKGSKLMLRGISLTATTNVIDMSASKLNVFPNPATGKVFVDVKEASEIGIYNLGGSLMKQQTVSSSQNAINISDLRKGIYFIKDMKSSQVQKLIVQ